MDSPHFDQRFWLDPDFRVIEPTNWRQYFRPGKVFKVPWAQPSPKSDFFDPWSADSKFHGEAIYQKVKRFIVLRSFKGHCMALAMSTYGGQGTTKSGLNPDDHAAVVPVGQEVKLMPGEQLKRQTIEIIVDNKTQTIASTARIDFTRLYTIEYSSKVLSIGRIVPSDIPRLMQYTMESLLKSKGPEGANADCLNEGSSDESVSNANESCSKSDPQAFVIGDRVLLPHRKNPSARAKLKPLLVESARLAPSHMQWEYRLRFEDKDALFGGGTYFSEERLLAA